MEKADCAAVGEKPCSVCDATPTTLECTVDTTGGVKAFFFCGDTCGEIWNSEVLPEMVRQGIVVVRR